MADEHNIHADGLRISAIAKCVGCCFWSRGGYNEHGIAKGQCRRKAPHITFVKGANIPMQTAWPFTLHDDWCGEHAVIGEV
jgi:hypothetical protein